MTEPVAWRTIVEGKTYVTDDGEFVVKMWQHNGWREEPLYTHPAKTLTDEEIHQVIFNLPNKDLDLFEFARAILKKAQEK